MKVNSILGPLSCVCKDPALTRGACHVLQQMQMERRVKVKSIMAALFIIKKQLAYVGPMSYVA